MKLKTESDMLANMFEKLWNIENRSYWLRQAMAIDISREEAVNDMISMLNNAIESFKKGAFLPPPEDIRLDIRIIKESYFQNWLLCGSFPIYEYEDGLRDFLGEMGGEANARPYPGMRFTAENNQSFTWIRHDSPQMVEVNLASLFEHNIKAVAYAYCTIDSEKFKR